MPRTLVCSDCCVDRPGGIILREVRYENGRGYCNCKCHSRAELVAAACTNDPAEIDKIRRQARGGQSISGFGLRPIDQYDQILGNPPRVSFNPNTVVREETWMSMLNALKNLNLERTDPDELVGLIAFGRMMVSTYTSVESEVPEWLTTNIESVEREFNARRQDAIAKEIKDTQARLEALKTSEQKRADLNAKLRRLKAQVK